MAAQKGRHRRARAREGDVGQLDPGGLVQHLGPQVVGGAAAAPPHGHGARFFLGIGDQILEGLELAVFPHDEDVGGAFEDVDLLQVERVVSGVAAGERLQDDVGKVVPRDGVPVGLAFYEFRPADRSAATDFIRDDDPILVMLLQRLLLEAGRDVGLAAGIEADDVGEGFARVLIGLGGGKEKQRGEYHRERNDALQETVPSHTRTSSLRKRHWGLGLRRYPKRHALSTQILFPPPGGYARLLPCGKRYWSTPVSVPG